MPPSSPPVMESRPATIIERAVVPAVRQDLSPFEREVLAGRITEPSLAAPPHAVPSSLLARLSSVKVIAALAVVTIVQAGVIAWLTFARPPQPVPDLTVSTTETGDRVLIRNGAATASPLAVAAAADLSWVRVTTPAPAGMPGATPATAASLRVSTPIPLTVSVGGRRLGAQPGAGLKVPAGRHEIDLANEALGYQVRQTIDVAGGETILVQVAPPAGSLTFDATIGTEVSVDGQVVGRTPLAPLTLAPGDYQVAFKYAKGTIERQRVTVKSAGTTAVVAARGR